MENLLIFTFKDLIAFIIPMLIGSFIFNKRRKRNQVTINGSFLWIALIIGSFYEIYNTIYITYSYRHSNLYNNDKFTTIFNYDFANIVFFVIVIIVSVFLFFQELRLKNTARWNQKWRLLYHWWIVSHRIYERKDGYIKMQDDCRHKAMLNHIIKGEQCQLAQSCPLEKPRAAMSEERKLAIVITTYRNITNIAVF